MLSISTIGIFEGILINYVNGPNIPASIHSGHPRYHKVEVVHSHHALSKLLTDSIFEHNKLAIDLCHKVMSNLLFYN